MKKIFILLLSLSLAFGSIKNIDADYDISYGIFGNLGIANAAMSIDKNNNYTIRMEAKATGFAKFLSSGKEESYVSKGVVLDGRFVPNIFIKSSSNSYKSYTKKYIIDREKQEVYMHKSSKRLIDGKWEESFEESKLGYFANEDILSLFFNLKDYLKDLEKGREYSYQAIGAKGENGNVDVIVPKGQKLKELEKKLGSNKELKCIVHINQKIFSSEKGELFLSLNDEGFSTKAVLNDVLIFGDVVGSLAQN